MHSNGCNFFVYNIWVEWTPDSNSFRRDLSESVEFLIIKTKLKKVFCTKVTQPEFMLPTSGPDKKLTRRFPEFFIGVSECPFHELSESVEFSKIRLLVFVKDFFEYRP